jgi:hypothetical protein
VIEDVFGIADGPATGFAPDALNGFAFSSSIDFIVDGRLGPQYRDAAQAIASRAVSDESVFDRIVPCAASDAGCRDTFVADFGLRAFRRPLTDDEQARFVALFDRGAELIGSGDTFRDGVELTVEALLQSPQFLYRTELGATPDADGVIPLNGWETASRLSFFLYRSMPDDALLEAARQDQLSSPEQVRAQVARMLGDPRALRTMVAFHEQAWQFPRFSNISPDPQTYPDVPEDVIGRVRAASGRFVEDVITSGGGLSDLLTAPFAYADSELAPLYGQQVDGELERIDLDPTLRKGFLMQIGFLAAHAYAIKTDPIHRGLFVVRELLCRTIPDPPPGASMSELPEGSSRPETTREEITLLTSPVECVGCHAQINPPGFAFEGYDAIGQVREQEDGVAIDASGSMVVDGETARFDGPVGLVDLLAQSEEAERCYASRWLEFASGRTLTPDELSVVDELTSSVAVTELVTNIIASAAFLTRTPNEVAE